MAEAGYKQLISYKLANIAFILGWEFVPTYYTKHEDSRQRDQIKQALRSHKQNIVEGSSDRSISPNLPNSPSGRAFRASPNLPTNPQEAANMLLTFYQMETFLLKRQIDSLTEKFVNEGCFRENLFKKRLAKKGKSY